jgi:8-oxo-dGTP diphosphatase
MEKRDTYPVGINIFVIRDGKLLLGKRKNVAGEGEWGLPGGHLENHESMIGAAARELREETNLQASKFRFANLVNYPQGEKHFLQVGFIAEDATGDVVLNEPDRCYEWKWFSLNELPSNLFIGHKDQIGAFCNGDIKFVDSK